MAGQRSNAAATPPSASRLGLLAVVPAALFILALRTFVAGGVPWRFEWPWIPSLGIDLAFRLDGLALLLVLLITGIGALVLVYAAGYLAGDPKRGRMAGLLVAFMVAMLGCVTADDLFVLFLFWELTSVSSFLLIGFKHEDDKSRKSAQQALVVTGGGGLVLLVGLLLLAEVAGTSSISVLLESARSWREHALVVPALVCIFVGAFTKSAQLPFHFWLPGAMAAPTPVSAYLHSATMVKLGVYLLARLHPAFGDMPIWQVTLVTVGAATSVWAMVLAIRERDLKRIFAWSTVSALGTLVMLIGLPGPGAATATAAFMLAHALYKAPLFFVAGNIDLATGTRIIDEVRALGRRMPRTGLAACLAGLSMAGIPLSFGYVAKDVIKAANAEVELFDWAAHAGVLVSAASVAAAAVATVRVFRLGGEPSPSDAQESSRATWLPPLLLGALGILLGIFPSIVHSLVDEAARAMGPAAGVAELRAPADRAASARALAITLALGAALFASWDRLHAAQKELRGPGILRASAWYETLLAAIPWTAARVTRALQRGQLVTYTALLLVASLGALGLGVAAAPRLALPALDLPLDAPGLAVGGAVLAMGAASVAVCVVRDSFVMLLVSGVVGLASGLLFLALGAPDVALTQVTVEVAFVVVVAAVLMRVRRLDLTKPPRPPLWRVGPRAAIALGGGAAVAGLVLLAQPFAPDDSLARFFAERSLPDAHGRNVVNVIIVDFRAVDTLGEIVVVAVVFLASLPLLRALREQPWQTDLAAAPPHEGARGIGAGALLLCFGARWLYPVMLVAAAVLLLRGHHEPGGGFIAGMVAVAATSLLAVSRGSRVALERLPLGPIRLAAASALLSLVSGLPALLVGKPYLTHFWTKVPLGFTAIDLSTVLLFDLGVFGVVWGALGGMCAMAIGLGETGGAAPRLAVAATEGPAAAPSTKETRA